ncbi:MAG: outer membrane protein [Hyphomicrobiaceae bacterium]
MRFAIFILALAICQWVAIAQAQQSTSDSSTVTSWNGLYAGAHVGVGTARFDGVFDSSAMTTPRTTLDSVLGEFFELDSGLAGIQIGYNRAVGQLVYGIEADWTRFNPTDQQFDPEDEGPCGCATDNASAEINWLATLRGRFGVSSAKTLLYVTAGIAWLDGEYQARDDDDPFPFFDVEGTADIGTTGFVVGGGLEHALQTATALRFEVLYYNFGERTDTSRLTNDSDVGDFAEVKDVFVARIAANYRFAGDASTGDPRAVTVPAMNWSGTFVGLHAGYAHVDFDSVFDNSEIDNPYDLENSVVGRWFDLDGGSGGISLGFNRTFAKFVYGVEADVTYLDKSDSRFDPDGGFATDDSATVELDWLASLRARLGVLSARTLFYGTAGGAWIKGRYLVNDDGVFEGSSSINDFGLVVGGGVEHAVTEHLTLRLEGLQYIFGDEHDTGALTPDSDAGDFASIENLTVFRIGLSHRFGGEP